MITREQWRDIYKAYTLGETMLSLAEQYNCSEKYIRLVIRKYTIGVPRERYWLGSPSLQHADIAKESFFKISMKYNTPSGEKRHG